MGKIQIEPIETKAEWEDLVLGLNPRSFLQSWNWGETNRLQGKKIYRLAVCENSVKKGACLVIVENAKRGRHLLIPGGPLIDWTDQNAVHLIISELKKIARSEKAWFIRIRPELSDNDENRIILKALHFKSAPMHLHAENTWVLSIDRSDEELLYQMRKNTRYNIRKSLTSGLQIEKYKDPKYSKVLKKLQDETVVRHKFTGFPESLFKAQLETFAPDGQAELFLCKKGSEVLAAAIIIYYGQYAYYHHSASTSKYKDLPFSYFLQWKIIQTARERGCKFYNFWGIAPTDNPKHRFAGVTIFKKGFGGERFDWVHAHDLATSPFYFTTYVFESLRRLVRKL